MMEGYDCPVCEHSMTNVTGNIFTCPTCDFTATDHSLDRIIEVTNTPSRRGRKHSNERSDFGAYAAR